MPFIQAWRKIELNTAKQLKTELRPQKHKKHLFAIVAAFVCILLIHGCTSNSSKSVKIAINSWPGYEFLYLAQKVGIYDQLGLNIELIELDSLSDVQRAYVNGYADGFASTVIEAVQAEVLSERPLKIILVPDYSNGGDVIIAPNGLSSIKDLKGKTVGAEVSSLGIFLLDRALALHGLSLNDVNIVNIEQLNGEQKMLAGEIDAFVTYPPVSVNILKHKRFHKIFTSAEIPNEIIDTVAVSETVLKKQPDFSQKLRKAWGLAINYYQANPQEAIQLMAEREGISPAEFKEVLSDLHIVSEQAQNRLFKNPEMLVRSTNAVCKTLVHIEAINTDCATISRIVPVSN